MKGADIDGGSGEGKILRIKVRIITPDKVDTEQKTSHPLNKVIWCGRTAFFKGERSNNIRGGAILKNGKSLSHIQPLSACVSHSHVAF